ncbi:MAG: mannonate dehydratase [Phycisphaerales bacterium]|nr:MAG: mannonate dehydratase [Phycisphaerales bacterium]
MPEISKPKDSERTACKPDRRAFGKAVLAGVLGGPTALSSIAQTAEERLPPDQGTHGGRAGAGDAGMKLALMLRPENKQRHILARQIGVNHAIVPLSRVLNKVRREKYLDTLVKVKATYEASGLVIAGVESHPVAAEKIKLGLPGRDEEIANYCAVIKALGKVGIPMCCYNFMAGIGWYRTRVDIPERGGALASEFDNRVAEQQGLTKWGKISKDKIWDNLTYFLQRIIPVAEKAGVKMALHPDDPPLSPLRGIGRILTSGEAFRRVLRIVPSPVNGIAFCQANFKLMGDDIRALVTEFGGQGKIFFVHLRDVTGTREHFRETFHDNGPTNMAEMLRLYHEVGFRGPIRPDHAPTLADESNQRPGYAMQGKVFAIGYIKGIMEALHIPVS